MSMYSLGNDLYTGKKSFDFIGKRKIWFTVALVAIVLSLASLLVRGLNLGVEFTGGSQFTISDTKTADVQIAEKVMGQYVGADAVRVSTIGDSSVRIQTSNQKISNAQAEEIRAQLAQEYKVDVSNVTSTFIGPSWGKDISKKALIAFVVFLVLASLGLSLYFRTWRNAAGAILALLNDLVVTVGVYSLIGFEVTPASVIGLLTILAYSLYDTVVVFDKVRENTDALLKQEDYTFAESTNLAVNQTLIRSINTSVTSLLPVASILVVGVWIFGATTLRDLALVMFVGLILSALSSMFIAAPLAVALTESDPEIKEHTARVLQAREERRLRREAQGDDANETIDDRAYVKAAGYHRGIAAQNERIKQKNKKKRKKK